MTEENQKMEFQALDAEYQEYIRRLKIEWMIKNPFNSRDVMEIWDDRERERATQHLNGWKCYITPLAEAWWKERGWGIIWPDDDSKPTQCYKLEIPA